MQSVLPRGAASFLVKTLIVAALLFGAAAARPAAAQQGFSESDLRELVQGLQNGTLRPSFVSEECARGMKDDPEGEEVKHFIASYLQVPEELALATFCDALTLSIKGGDVGLQALILINRQDDTAPMALEIGRLLRSVYFRHQETSTAALEAEPAR